MEKRTGKIKSFNIEYSPVGSEYTAIVTPDSGGSDITIIGHNLNASYKPGDNVTYLTTTDPQGNHYYTLKF